VVIFKDEPSSKAHNEGNQTGQTNQEAFELVHAVCSLNQKQTQKEYGPHSKMCQGGEMAVDKPTPAKAEYAQIIVNADDSKC